MKFSIHLIIITALFCITIGNAKAQSGETTVTPSHLQAAGKFLVAVGIGDQFKAITDNIINTASAQIPEEQRAAFKDVMRKFMDTYYTWDIVKDPLSKIYAQEFDETELNQLSDFYNSPVGKKYSAKMAALMQKGMLMGQQIMNEHKTELVKMMEDASKQH